MQYGVRSLFHFRILLTNRQTHDRSVVLSMYAGDEHLQVILELHGNAFVGNVSMSGRSVTAEKL